MYEKFTDYVHKVMLQANREAQRFHHEYIGQEHVLLAITKVGKGAVHVLTGLDVDVQKVRLELENAMKSGLPNGDTIGKLPLTTGMKHVMEYAMEEARNLNHPYVGTHHLLLGLLREEEGLVALWNVWGITFENVRAEIRQLSEEDERPLFSPGDPDQHVRNAIRSIWEALPEEVRDVSEVERQIRGSVDRALRDFRDNIA